MNICEYIINNNLPHKVLSDGRIEQLGSYRIIDKDITSLDGFIQNGSLDLRGNDIESLEGFVTNKNFPFYY
jgi:hypothetical protein